MDNTEYYINVLKKIYKYNCRSFLYMSISIVILLSALCLMCIFIYYRSKSKYMKSITKSKYKTGKIKKINADLKKRKKVLIFECILIPLITVIFIIFGWKIFSTKKENIFYDINNKTFKVYEGEFVVKPPVSRISNSRSVITNYSDILFPPKEDFGRVIFNTVTWEYSNYYTDCYIIDMYDKMGIYDKYSNISVNKKYNGTVVYGEQSKAVVFWDIEEYNN